MFGYFEFVYAKKYGGYIKFKSADITLIRMVKICFPNTYKILVRIWSNRIPTLLLETEK